MNTAKAFPDQGQSWRTLEQELTQYQDGEMPYERGIFERYWPAYPDDVYLAARSAQEMFAHTNLFSMNAIPSLKRIEEELREIVADILGMPEDGAVTLTVGGTESNFLAVKAARKRGRELGITQPNLVIPMTGHPSFDKAGDELGVEIRRVEVGPDYRAIPDNFRQAIDDQTILIAGSAPSYPQGVIDPIEDLAAVAAERDIWMHVDACVGGFLLNFLRKAAPETPRFAFDVPGVWSVSADLHKFGFALNGLSSFTVRDSALQALHSYVLPDHGWHYRGYQRVGFAGSRPGGTLAAAWATFRMLGRDGYEQSAASILETGRQIAAGAAAIEGLRVDVPPEAGLVVIFSNDGTDLEAVSAAMLGRGWDVSTALTPSSLHLLMSPHMEHLVAPFLEDLTGAVADVRSGAVESGSTEFNYGD